MCGFPTLCCGTCYVLRISCWSGNPEAFPDHDPTSTDFLFLALFSSLSSLSSLQSGSQASMQDNVASPQMDFIKLPSPLKVSSSCSGRLDPGSRCYGFQRCRFWPLGHAPEGIQSLREIPETEPRREPRFSPWECQLPSIVLTWLPARASLEHTVLQQQGWYFWSVFCVLDIILTTLPIHAFVVGFTKTCLLAPTDYINSLPTSHCKL